MANWYVGTTKWSAIPIWVAGTVYSVGDIRRQTAALGTLTVGNERAFRCTTAGTSGGTEPTWVLTRSATTADNDVVWTEVTGEEAYGWGAAHARLKNAFTSTWGAAGDTFWVSNNSYDTRGDSVTLAGPGTPEAPCKVLCVDDTSGTPPTTLAPPRSATIAVTGSSTLSVAGCTTYYGIHFHSNVGAAAVSMYLAFSSVPTNLIFKGCKFTLGTYSTARLNIDGSALGSSGLDHRTVVFNDVIINLGHTSQGLYLGPIRFLWQNTLEAIDASRVTPTNLFIGTISTYVGSVGSPVISGVDLSAMGASKSLVSAATNATGEYKFSNCKLGADVSAISGAIPGQGGVNVFLDNCDSADPSVGPRSEAYTYQGSVKTDTAVYRTGGTSDGTPYSLKMVTNADGVSFISPLVTRPIHKAADTVGSEITATVAIVQAEGSTPLTEAECWVEVEYMGTSGNPITSLINDHNSTLLAASTTDQTTSAETWTGLSGTPVKQKLAVPFTPAEKGYYMARVYLARASATVYICPKITVS